MPGYATAVQSANIPADGYVTVNFVLTPIPPKTYYVDSFAGDDSNDGLSTNTPWLTITNGDARGILNPGDTVVISGYFLTLLSGDKTAVSMNTCSGTPSLPITYMSTQDTMIDTVPYTDPSDDSVHGSCVKINADYIALNGIWVNGTCYPLTLNDTTGSIVENCTVTSSDWSLHGLWISGGIDCCVHNNIINMTATSGASLSPGVADDDSGTGNMVVNNTIYACTGAAYESPDDETGRVFKNNILYECGYGIHAGNTGIDHGHNILWEVPAANLIIPGTDSTYVLNATEGVIDPMLVDPDNPNQLMKDFNLQAGSPAIDAGAYVGLPFQGLWPDIGAFEYPGPVQPALVTVTGWVKNTAGTAISGAAVTAGAYSNASTTTNSSGNYTLVNVPGVAMTMSASANGYGTVTQTPNLATARVVNFTVGLVPPLTRLSQLRVALDNTNFSMAGSSKIVTVSSGVLAGNVIYIEESDRTCGIKVALASGQSVAAGNGITLTGTIKTDANGERYIQCTSIDSNDNATTAPKAVGIANNGITNLVGTLVRVWGSTTPGSGVVTVNDGGLFPDGTSGIKVSTTGITKTIGSFLFRNRNSRQDDRWRTHCPAKRKP